MVREADDHGGATSRRPDLRISRLRRRPSRGLGQRLIALRLRHLPPYRSRRTCAAIGDRDFVLCYRPAVPTARDRLRTARSCDCGCLRARRVVGRGISAQCAGRKRRSPFPGRAVHVRRTRIRADRGARTRHGGAPAGAMTTARSRSVTVVGIVTRDRETSLAACLASYLANCRRHARSPEFVVVDGSAGEENSARTRAALRAVAATSDATIRYAGRAEKKRFADALVRE